MYSSISVKSVLNSPLGLPSKIISPLFEIRGRESMTTDGIPVASINVETPLFDVIFITFDCVISLFIGSVNLIPHSSAIFNRFKLRSIPITVAP
ncbi:hypothetical protein ES708_34835 [subsurface metagenome]